MLDKEGQERQNIIDTLMGKWVNSDETVSFELSSKRSIKGLGFNSDYYFDDHKTLPQLQFIWFGSELNVNYRVTCPLVCLRGENKIVFVTGILTCGDEGYEIIEEFSRTA